jgi:membrane protease subunit (stomatin/prohibitin family)
MLVEKQVCLLQIAGKLSEISLSLQEKISGALEDYGLQIVSFQVNSISVSETDPSVRKLKEALAKRAEMNILGYTYQQERSFDTMEAAAGNSGTGGAAINAGIGLGMGVGFAAPMSNMASAIGQNIAQGPQQVLCWKCGKPRSADSAFCASCGAPVKSPAADGVVCPKCGSHLPAATKFCGNCGSKLEMVCPSCKKPTTPGASFCQECGASLK